MPPAHMDPTRRVKLFRRGMWSSFVEIYQRMNEQPGSPEGKSNCNSNDDPCQPHATEIKICLSATIFSAACLLLLPHSAIGADKSCSPQPPGIESARVDVINEIILQKIDIDPKGQQGYVATEYSGSPNLQTSIYIEIDKKYCLLADLGGATSVITLPRGKEDELSPLRAASTDGAYRYSRTYRYRNNTYVQIKCSVKEAGKPSRACSKSEQQS